MTDETDIIIATIKKLLAAGVLAIVLLTVSAFGQPRPLPFTSKGCLVQPNMPEHCGYLIYEQGRGELRQLKEHIRREVKTIRRPLAATQR